MALRKNNQEDYEKFANPDINVLGEPKKLAGENTDEIKKDKKGNPFALVMESTQSGLMKGDTVRPAINTPISGNYIMGGDYTVSKKSDKNYKID